MAVLFLFPFTVNAGRFSDLVDKSMDKLDPIQAYERLSEVMIDTNQELTDFVADGCSGEISKTWDERIYPVYIRPQLGPDAPERIPFPAEDCCLVHDKVYHRGFDSPLEDVKASSAQLEAAALWKARKDADLAFKKCINVPEKEEQFIDLISRACVGDEASREELLEKRAEVDKVVSIRKIAALMYAGVRFGGRPCSNHDYRFGYGYDDCRDHGTSTPDTALKVLMDLIDSML